MLRTALVGLGRIGVGFHGPALRSNANFKLVGIVDPLGERRVEIQGAWSVPAYASLEDLLSAHEVDLVVIASPTPFHVEQTKASFAAGAHVLCDKPAATSVDGFDAMQSAARRARRRLLVFQPARFSPEVLALRDILHRGTLGPLHYIRRSRCAYARRNDWQSQRALGGGMLNNWGPHCLDEIVSLLPGETFSQVTCFTRVIASAGDAEDFVSARLVSSRGVLIDVDISQACSVPSSPWEVRGLHGSAIFDAGAKTWRTRYFDPSAAGPAPALQDSLAARGRSYNQEELPWQEHIVAAADFPEPDFYAAAHRFFAEDGNAPVTLEDSRLVMELIERCRADADARAAGLTTPDRSHATRND